MTRSIFTDLTHASERGKIMGASMITIGISVIIFPTAASYILTAFGWQSIALVTGGLLVAALCLSLLLKEKDVGQWK
jgi:MFS family permease